MLPAVFNHDSSWSQLGKTQSFPAPGSVGELMGHCNGIAVSGIVSGADKTITVLENGNTVASGPATISDAGTPLGSNVFILSHADGDRKGLAWHAVGHGPGDDAAAQPDDSVITCIRAEPDVVEAMRQRMHAGLVLVTTDLPSTPDTTTGQDFVILNQGDA